MYRWLKYRSHYKMHGHHLVNYNEIHENLQAFVSLDKMSLNSDNRGLDNWLRMHCNQFSTSNYAMKISHYDNYHIQLIVYSTNAASFYGGRSVSKLDFIIIVWYTCLGIISIHVYNFTWRGTHFYLEG